MRASRRATVYRYFASKEDLFRRVVQDLNERWVELARTALSEPGPAHERLARLGPASIEFHRNNKLLTSILNRDTEIIHAPLLDDIRRKLIRENVTLMAEVIRDAIAEGSMRPVDPERAAFIVFMAGQTLFTQEDRPYQEVLPLYRRYRPERPPHRLSGSEQLCLYHRTTWGISSISARTHLR